MACAINECCSEVAMLTKQFKLFVCYINCTVHCAVQLVTGRCLPLHCTAFPCIVFRFSLSGCLRFVSFNNLESKVYAQSVIHWSRLSLLQNTLIMGCHIMCSNLHKKRQNSCKQLSRDLTIVKHCVFETENTKYEKYLQATIKGSGNCDTSRLRILSCNRFLQLFNCPWNFL